LRLVTCRRSACVGSPGTQTSGKKPLTYSWARTQIEAERKLRNEFDKAQPGGTIGNLIADEQAWWFKSNLGPRLTELERCCNLAPDLRKLQLCREVDPCEELQKFIAESVKGDANHARSDIKDN
jgi:hypothetical protein